MRPHQGLATRGRRLRSRVLELVFDTCARSRRFRQIAMRKLFAEHCAASALGYVEFDDHRLFVDPRDDKIAFRLLRGRPWQRDILDTAVAVLQTAGALRSGRWFVDVGANIGTQTIYALKSGAFAHALAVEAEAGNFRLLQRNVAANALERHVRPVNAAASHSRRDVVLTLNRKNFGGHSLEPDRIKRPSSTATVRALPLDDILVAEDIAVSDMGLVWIDVEGHETAVLQGMQRLRAAAVPIVFEHTGIGSSDRPAAIRELLAPSYRYGVVLQAALERHAGRDPRDLAVPLRELQLGAAPCDILVFGANAALP
ncbi:MAG: FkbM family methyltransferase [Hyphomicrobiaceae bacterium]